MNKIAQRRGLLNKIREKANLGGKLVEKFSPEFGRLMDTLREVDEDVREGALDLKDMLKAGRSNFNRSEYMTTISYLGRFHERMELVRWQFMKLLTDMKNSHNEFLFNDLDQEHKDYLFDKLPNKFKPKPKLASIKEAGVADWWHNLTNDRGRSLKAWEKRFPKTAKELRRSTERMLDRSESFLTLTLSTLKTLATLRATRKLEEYAKQAELWNTKFNAYDQTFAQYFNTIVKPFVDTQKQNETVKVQTPQVGTQTSEQTNVQAPAQESFEDETDRPTNPVKPVEFHENEVKPGFDPNHRMDLENSPENIDDALKQRHIENTYTGGERRDFSDFDSERPKSGPTSSNYEHVTDNFSTEESQPISEPIALLPASEIESSQEFKPQNTAVMQPPPPSQSDIDVAEETKGSGLNLLDPVIPKQALPPKDIAETAVQTIAPKGKSPQQAPVPPKRIKQEKVVQAPAEKAPPSQSVIPEVKQTTAGVINKLISLSENDELSIMAEILNFAKDFDKTGKINKLARKILLK